MLALKGNSERPFKLTVNWIDLILMIRSLTLGQSLVLITLGVRGESKFEIRTLSVNPTLKGWGVSPLTLRIAFGF